MKTLLHFLLPANEPPMSRFGVFFLSSGGVFMCLNPVSNYSLCCPWRRAEENKFRAVIVLSENHLGNLLPRLTCRRRATFSPCSFCSFCSSSLRAQLPTSSQAVSLLLLCGAATLLTSELRFAAHSEMRILWLLWSFRSPGSGSIMEQGSVPSASQIRLMLMVCLWLQLAA